MTKIQQPDGNLFLWHWSDAEIENPNQCRQKLKQIIAAGFSGVLIYLSGARYEFTDAHVIRTIASVSQWARHRGFVFWFQADPRWASRTLIASTGERLNTWCITTQAGKCCPNIVQIKENRFNLKYKIPKPGLTPHMQERAVVYYPLVLEKAFIFQKEKEKIVVDSVKDITPLSGFFVNMAQGYVEVFGEVCVPDNEAWWVMAFPRFETNLFDYGGRKSIDRLRYFVEDLFEVGAYIDGFVWGDAGLLCHQGQLPVSESMLQSFHAEFQYNLLDQLYALVLETDDYSHIQVRHQYYTFLEDTISSAQQDFYTFVHSFLGDAQIGIQHSWDKNNKSAAQTCGSLNPWHGVHLKSIGLTELSSNDTSCSMEILLGEIAVTRSLGLVVKNKEAFCELPVADTALVFANHFVRIAAMNSIRLILDVTEDVDADEVRQINEIYAQIEAVTQNHFSDANTALIFPIECMMSANIQEAGKMRDNVFQLIGQLIASGIQLDVLPPDLFIHSQINTTGLHLGLREYNSVIIPYPHVLSSALTDYISLLKTRGFPVIMCGGKPHHSLSGDEINGQFENPFCPDIFPEIQWLHRQGVTTPFQKPADVVVAAIQREYDVLILACPLYANCAPHGDIRYKDILIPKTEINGLKIFSAKADGSTELMLSIS